MEHHDRQFHPESVDVEIDQLLQTHNSAERTEQTRIRFVHEMSNLYLEDSQVLDRAWKRLSSHMQSGEPAILSQEPLSIQRYQTKRRNRSMINQTLPASKPDKKLVIKRLSVMGSGLVAALVVASVIIAFLAYHQSTTGNIVHHTAPVTQTATKPTQQTSIQGTTRSVAGPAASYIPAAALATNINRMNQPVAPASTFKQGQTFYVTFTAQPGQKQWQLESKVYVNNKLYLQRSTLPNTIPIPVNYVSYNYAIALNFTQPVSGRVELYYHNQLARTLYFTVK